MSGAVADFEALFDFPLDRFQLEAIGALDAGRSVLVAAPTGAGKTVVGEFSCHQAIEEGGRTFYTTPIKALSNQKFRDLSRRYGEDRVGLLTGDRSINPTAAIVVMTTEVLRNMIYESSSALDGLRHVVLDEVHYLADRERGAVWEEVIIQVPASVQLACLSATVSNAEEFGAWLDTVREGGCEIVIEEHRPIPLGHHYFVNDRIHPTFKAGKTGHKGGKGKQPHPKSKAAEAGRKSDQERQALAEQALAGVPNPDVVMLERRAGQRNRVSNKGRRQGPEVRLRYPDRVTVVEELRHRKWLPAILFVFSRQGCEDAVEQLVRAGVRLTNREERDQIAALADLVTSDLPGEDLEVLGYGAFRQALMDGVAAHHAGLVPAFKEAVEVCFQRGLLKVVVATETLALGINMPAKTVVIERLEKWNGESHVLLTPGQYTQLTGRAGRRGIDKRGNAVVLYQRSIDFRTVAGLVGTRTYPLESSFAPSYNMAVNLLRRHSLDEAEIVLGASFAQFQADRSVAGTGKRLADLERGLRGYQQHLHSERGDWPAYWELRRELARLEKSSSRERRRRRRQRLNDGLAALNPGDVVHLPWLGRRGMAAVIAVKQTSKGGLVVDVVADDRALTRVGARELDEPPATIGKVRLPGSGNPRQREYRTTVANKLRGLTPPDGDPRPSTGDPDGMDDAIREQVADLRARIKEHPCHDDPRRDEIETWQYRYDEARADADRIRQDVEHRTGSLVRQLHRILDVLRQLEYVDEQPQPTDAGRILAGIHGEMDLLIAESVRRGLLDDLQPAELAAIVALFTYQARRDDQAWLELPTRAVAEAVEAIEALATELRDLETMSGVDAMRDLDPAFVGSAYRWAGGSPLDDALGNLEMSGGDFVRNVKQVVDVVGQLRHVGGPALHGTAELTLDRLRRGIVDT